MKKHLLLGFIGMAGLMPFCGWGSESSLTTLATEALRPEHQTLVSIAPTASGGANLNCEF